MTVPTRTQSITIEIEDLAEIVKSSLDRIIGEIDPTLQKFQNISTALLSLLEERIQTNVKDILYWLQVNLFILLVGTIVLFIIVLILLLLLDMLLVRYEFTPEKRHFTGLAVITIISLWLLIAIILSIWPPTPVSELDTLKYILFGLITAVVLYLIGAWIYSIYVNRHRIHRGCLQTCGCSSHVRVVVQSRSRRKENDLELEPTTM